MARLGVPSHQRERLDYKIRVLGAISVFSRLTRHSRATISRFIGRFRRPDKYTPGRSEVKANPAGLPLGEGSSRAMFAGHWGRFLGSGGQGRNIAGSACGGTGV